MVKRAELVKILKEQNIDFDNDDEDSKEFSKLLDKALDNDKNDKILNLTNDKILQMNLDIIKELHLSREDTFAYMKKLKGYKFVDEIDEIKYGAYIKWIPIGDPTRLPLNNGGIICDIKITEQGTRIVCKNFSGKFYQLKMDESLIFQKLSNEELILLNAIDQLES
jgi:hypothetical protein